MENLTFVGDRRLHRHRQHLANIITGGAGNDTLDGGLNSAGADTLIGGAGNDTYIVRNAGDVITGERRTAASIP